MNYPARSNSVLLEFSLKTEPSLQSPVGRELGSMGPKHTGADGSTWCLQILNTSSLICHLRKANFTILSNQAARKTWESRIFFLYHIRQHLWAWKCAKRHILIFQSFTAHTQSLTPVRYVQVSQRQLRKPSEDLLSRGIPWEQISSVTTSRPQQRGWTGNMSKPEKVKQPVAAR